MLPITDAGGFIITLTPQCSIYKQYTVYTFNKWFITDCNVAVSVVVNNSRT